MKFFKLFTIAISIFSVTALVKSSTTWASPDLDRLFTFENVGWVKPVDNIDGIFDELIKEEYSSYFQNQKRFIIKDVSGVESVLTGSSLSYSQLIYDPDILRKISRQFKVESIIRTRISKEGETYRFALEWVYAPRGDILSRHEFRFFDPEKEDGVKKGELPNLIENALSQLIQGLPFLGQINGVQGDTILVNMGRNQGVFAKQILSIETIRDIRRHPLERTIEEWRWQRVGRAQITEVEDSISFARVIELEPQQEMMRFQKVREVENPPKETKKPGGEEPETDPLPRIGWVAGNVGAGIYQREVGVSGGAAGRAGSGRMGAFKIEGMAWLNSRFMIQGGLGAGLIVYSPTNLVTKEKIGLTYYGNTNQFRAAVGYSFFPARTVFDTVGWVHAGYKSTSYTLAASSTDFTGSNRFGSLFFGVGGEMPIRGNFAAQMGLDIGLIRSVTQTAPDYGDTGSTSDLMFNLGGTYRLTHRSFVRLILEINAQSADFVGGESISQKMITLSPSFMYYF